MPACPDHPRAEISWLFLALADVVLLIQFIVTLVVVPMQVSEGCLYRCMSQIFADHYVIEIVFRHVRRSGMAKLP